jgi:hypothetical protein
MFKPDIRILQKQDVKALGAIYDLYWDGVFREKLTRKIDEFLENSQKIKEENVCYYIAELNNEIQGAISFRNAPVPMIKYTTSNKPLEPD